MERFVATKTQVREIESLMERYPESCSICLSAYDDDEDEVIYTVFGYDKNETMQVTTGCCAGKIVKPVMLGLCGCFDPDEKDEIMANHPMAGAFFPGTDG